METEFRLKDRNFQKKIMVCFLVVVGVVLLLVVAGVKYCDVLENDSVYRLLAIVIFALALAIPTIAGMLFMQKREGHWIRHGYYSVNKAEYPDGSVCTTLGKKHF